MAILTYQCLVSKWVFWPGFFCYFVLLVSEDHDRSFCFLGGAPFRILFTHAFLMFCYMEAKVVLQTQRSVLLKRHLNILIVVVSSFHINSCLAT